MIKTKKNILILALSFSVLTITACGTAGSSVPSSAAVTTESVTTAASESHSDENTISGIVTGGTEHSINITAKDGTELEFYISDSTIQDYEDGYLIDRKVLITYTGLIDGTNTDSVKVLKVSDYD